MMTGHRSEMEPLVQQVIADGARAVFYKPFDLPELLSTVTSLADE
jgi:hypothetical protein